MLKACGAFLASVLFLAVCQTSLSAAGLNVAHINTTLGLGYGYNPTVGEFYTPCVEVEAPTTSDRSVGVDISTRYEVKQIKSKRELRDLLNVNAYAATFGGAGSLRADVRKMVETSVTEENDYFYVSVRVTGIVYPFKGSIRLTSAALEALKQPQPEAFFKRYCGDSYVDSLKGGGEFSALVTVEKLTTKEANEFETRLQAAYGQSKLDVETEKYFSDLRTQRRLTVQIAVSGETGSPPSSLTDIRALMEFARTFPTEIQKQGARMSTSAITYQKYMNTVEFETIRQMYHAADRHSPRSRNLAPMPCEMEKIAAEIRISTFPNCRHKLFNSNHALSHSFARKLARPETPARPLSGSTAHVIV
jgi:hypothetical protein